MKQWALVLLFVLPAARAGADVVFSQPPAASGAPIASSWVDPNGSDADMYVYESFILPSDQSITEIDWRGGYLYNALYGRATNFSVTFYESIAGGSEPHVNNPQLPEIYLAYYETGGNAGETAAGNVGGTAMFDYKFVLPTPFQAAANTRYWVRIEASQGAYPDWGIAAGTGGDGQHFQFSTGAARFSFGGGDTAFTLRSASGSLQVALAPPEAIAAGAKWRRTGTTLWRDAATSETAVPAGDWRVEFKSMPGWAAPTGQDVTVATDQVTSLQGLYFRIFNAIKAALWMAY